MPAVLISVLIFVILFRAAILTYHELRMQKVALGQHLDQKARTPNLELTHNWVTSNGFIVQSTTKNEKGRLLGIEQPIQSARFIKPVERVVRHDDLPVLIPFERNIIKKFKNWVFSVPVQRIVVQEFTEEGIIFDEENTDGAEIKIQFYKKPMP